MEHFNYDEWKKNPKRKVVTRDGRVAKIINYNQCLSLYPVKVEVEHIILQVTSNGVYNIHDISANDLFFIDESIKTTNGVVWRKCKAGYKFPSDAIVIPDDERTTDRDPRLVRCAVWDSKYILIDDLKKLPVDNG